MRIMLVSNNYTPYSGGVVSSLQATMQALHTHGHDPLLVTLSFGHNPPDPSNVRRVTCPLQFNYRTNHLAVPWRPYQEILGLIDDFKPEIIHTHHPFLLGVAALRAAQKRSIPVIFTHHTQYAAYAHYVPLPAPWTQPVIRHLVSTYCARVDHIIAPSCGIKEMLVAQGITTPISVIASALKKPFIPQDPWVAKEIRKDFKLVCVSRCAPEKNLPCLFELLAGLQDLPITLTIVGFGPLWQSLQDMAYQQYKFSHDQVIFIHKPSAAELKKQYQDTDLFVFPSQTDTQGIVLAEAFSCGTPVVALDGIGQRDCIVQGTNGFIAPSVNAMNNCIRTVYHDRALHQSLQKNAWQAAQGYLPDTIFEKLMTAYKALGSVSSLNE